MIAMGFGMASVFTTTSIATQNAVEFHDLGVATATIMFFRSLGGAFGLAVFGTILNATIRSEIPARLGVTPDEAAGLIREPDRDRRRCPTASRAAPSSTASALGVGRIYLVCAGVMVVAFVAAVLMPERPLRPARRPVRRHGGAGRGGDGLTVMAFPGHAGRSWPIARWRSLTRIRRTGSLTSWRSPATQAAPGRSLAGARYSHPRSG